MGTMQIKLYGLHHISAVVFKIYFFLSTYFISLSLDIGSRVEFAVKQRTKFLSQQDSLFLRDDRMYWESKL